MDISHFFLQVSIIKLSLYMERCVFKTACPILLNSAHCSPEPRAGTPATASSSPGTGASPGGVKEQQSKGKKELRSKEEH